MSGLRSASSICINYIGKLVKDDKKVSNDSGQDYCFPSFTEYTNKLKMAPQQTLRTWIETRI